MENVTKACKVHLALTEMKIKRLLFRFSNMSDKIFNEAIEEIDEYPNETKSMILRVKKEFENDTISYAPIKFKLS